MIKERKEISLLIKEAQEVGARQSKACEIVGISEKTLQRWNQEDNEQDGRLDAKHTPKNKLTEQERDRMIQIARVLSH